MDGRLARVRGQNILFSPTQQTILTLNDTAADIWTCLEEGESPAAIASKIAGCGIDPHEARRYVESALDHWRRLDLVRPAALVANGTSRDSQVIALPGLNARIVYAARHRPAAATVFRHLETEQHAADMLFQVVESGTRIHLFRDHEWIASCSADELPTTLKTHLLDAVLEGDSYEIALHAAALSRDDRLLMLCGVPGAGKTTLALALTHEGFGFAGDDVTLLDATGRAIGIPFAAATKPGAWRVLRKYWPNLQEAPVFRRPDRKRVRYLVPDGIASSAPREVGWVVLLHRCRNSDEPRLEAIDPAGALCGMLNGAFAARCELSVDAFRVLMRVIGSAATYCLHYSRLGAAAELLRRACQ
jgi:hypothetical protein